jgi:DNA-binding NarL/FixJ family response regulator
MSGSPAVLFGLVCALSSAVLAQAWPREEIADSVNISESSVKSQIKHIVGMLGASDRIHAVTLAVRRGLLHV